MSIRTPRRSCETVDVSFEPPSPYAPPPGQPASGYYSAPPPAKQRKGFTTASILALIGAVLLGIGSFLAWATVASVFGSISVNGMDGDGQLTAAAGTIAAILFLVGALGSSGFHIAGVVFAGLGGAVAAYDLVNITNTFAEYSSDGVAASVGVGLYVCVVGAVVAVVAGVAAARS